MKTATTWPVAKGFTRLVRKLTLKSLSKEDLVIEMEGELEGKSSTQEITLPLKGGDAKKSKVGEEELEAGGKKWKCTVFEVEDGKEWECGGTTVKREGVAENGEKLAMRLIAIDQKVSVGSREVVCTTHEVQIDSKDGKKLVITRVFTCLEVPGGVVKRESQKESGEWETTFEVLDFEASSR